jgi:hypothetical protein
MYVILWRLVQERDRERESERETMQSPMTADCFAGETSVVVLVIYRLEGREGAPCSPCRRIFCLAHRSIVDQPRPALVVNKTVVMIISYRPTQ